MTFRLRLHLIPYSWLDRADKRLHRRGEHTGWGWLCNVKDRRLGWEDDERLWSLWVPHKMMVGEPLRSGPKQYETLVIKGGKRPPNAS